MRGLILILLVGLIGLAQANAASQFAFVNFNVVPMDSNRVLRGYSVVVRDGSIEALGPKSKVELPSDATRIDGEGRHYLLPGLADMHVHASRPDDLPLYVCNGVTTVLHMGGDPVGAAGNLKRVINRADVPNPVMFFALKVDGSTGFGVLATDPENGRHIVQVAKSNGYDFIKLYNDLSEPVLSAMAQEAHTQRIALIGHGVRSVGLPAALFRGQVMVAHAEEFLYTAFNKSDDARLMRRVAAETRRADAYVTPTLATYEAIAAQWGKPSALERHLSDARARFLTPDTRANWINSNYIHRDGSISANIPKLRMFTRLLSDEGVPLLAGTDSPSIPGMYPGYSMHEELRSLSASGLSNFQTLSAATRTPGEFIDKHTDDAQLFGQIAPRYRGDLVAVHDNPLESLETLQRPIGVLRGNLWLPEERCTELLETTAEKYNRKIR